MKRDELLTAAHEEAQYLEECRDELTTIADDVSHPNREAAQALLLENARDLLRLEVKMTVLRGMPPDWSPQGWSP